jgi:nitrite reductase/ring-hydroxylating ferredoxin subunit
MVKISKSGSGFVKRNNNALLIFIVLPFLLVFACKKDNPEDQIPYAYINIYIEPNSTMYLPLNVVGGSVYLTAASPSKGLIVYRTGVDEFVAFERTCPNDPANNCDTGPVKIEHAGTTAVDSCCMSRFILQDGSVFAGPSKYPLRSYRTEYNGSILHIYN